MIWVPPPHGWEEGRRPPPRPPGWLPVQRDPDRFFDIPRALARETDRPWTVPEWAPPPEVLRAFRDLGPGGNWEGGTVDAAGRRWTHQPYVGWRTAGPDPYHTASGRLYTSTGVRRRRRREAAARLAVPPGGLAALALMCGGLVNFELGWAIAGVVLAVLLAALVGWGLSGGRPR